MTGGRTRVYFTVDVECAEERLGPEGIRPPLGWDERVWGRFANQREELGIDLIMRELDLCGLKGTFFVEALGAAYFGEDGLRDVVQALRGRGHDVQLHTHPVQRRADFRSRGEKGAPDNIADYPVEEQAGLLRDGLDALVRCGVPREELNSFRAGNFGANNDTWRGHGEGRPHIVVEFQSLLPHQELQDPLAARRKRPFRHRGRGVGVADKQLHRTGRRVPAHPDHGGLLRGDTGLPVRGPAARPAGGHPGHPFVRVFLGGLPREETRAGEPRQPESPAQALRFPPRPPLTCSRWRRSGALARRLPPAPAGRIDQHLVPRGKARHRFGRLLEQAYKRVEARLPF